MKRRAMVVEDSRMVREQLRALMHQAGIETIEAEDGFQALEKLAANEDVALVICDVNMPRMDGLEFLEKARADARWRDLPVVMLTTEVQTQLVQRAKALGAKGWVIKPFNPASMLALVKKFADAA